MNTNDLVKGLILSKPHQIFDELQLKFPNRIAVKFVDPSEVFCWLSAGDYGLLIRDKSVTNSCASPTKYAEYLLAGLRVISNKTTGAGEGVGLIPANSMSRSTTAERKANSNKAIHRFAKNNFKKEYEAIMQQEL